MSLISLLIYLIVLGVVIALIYYITTALPIPEPLGQIIRVVAMVIACLVVILIALIYYITTALPIPEPLGQIIRVVAMVIACLVVILILLQLAGIGTGISIR